MACFVLHGRFTFDDVVFGAFDSAEEAEKAASKFDDQFLTQAINDNPSANGNVLDGDFIGFDILEVDSSGVTAVHHCKTKCTTF